MQMLSRDSTRPENNKKSFCCELLNRTTLGQCIIQASTKLCLAVFEFLTVLESKRFFQLDLVPPRQFYQILTPSLLNI